MYGVGVTTTTNRKGSLMETRTYETISIRWARGSVWSGGYTRDEAQAVVDKAAARGEVGTVEVTPFTVEIDPKFAHLYRPGI